RFEKGPRVLVRFAAGRARLRLIEPQRWNAQRLSRHQPVLGLRALAVDAHLAFADDALDMGKAQPGKPRFEKPVDAHAGFVGGDRDVLDAAFTSPRLRGEVDRVSGAKAVG